MARAIIGVCTLELDLAGVDTLKEKRSILQALSKRLRSTFNLSIAEIDYQDVTNLSVVAFAVVSNSSQHAQQMIDTILNWIEQQFDDAEITDQMVEII